MTQKKLFTFLRIAFGFVWAIDAWFKWQPTFINGFIGYLNGTLADQPSLIQAWIHLWIHIVSINPHFFAIAVASIETLIALCLIFGWFKRTTIVVGIILSCIIWSAAEGFGGPYGAGSTDIGCAIIYVFVFAALWIAELPEHSNSTSI